MQYFGSQFFHFFRSGITTTCGGLTLRQRFPYILGTTSGFYLTQCTRETIPHPIQNIITLFMAFVPANQNILPWATLHFTMLHHCISSVLCCKPNTHFMQGPKNDYTHAYSHPLSNLLSFQSPFWSLSVFSSAPFPILHSHPIASNKSAAHYLNFPLNMLL